MEYLKGYRDAVKAVEEVTNGVVRKLVKEGDLSVPFMITQMDKFISMTYMLRYQIERKMDEANREEVECDCFACSGEYSKDELDLLLKDLMGLNKTEGSDK